MIDLFSAANIGWLAVGLIFTVLTFVAATANLIGVVPEQISIWKTFSTQWASKFATLVAPPTIGFVAINVRFLVKQGLSSASAGASIAVIQVLAFISHVGLLVVMAIVAGTSSELAFRPSRTVITWVVIVALLIAGLVSIPSIRDWLGKKIKPIVSQVIPRFTSLANQPVKLISGIVGVLMLNLTYIGALYASVRAFTPEAAFATVAVVYLAGSVIGQAAPTPGGLGAVEAAIAAGLTASGIDAGVAVSATLLFRLLTFWFPTIPGWIAFRNLQRTGDL